MRIQNRLSIPSVTLAALLFATPNLLLAGGPGAGGCRAPSDLFCEVSIPTGTFWWNYFNSVGFHVTFDDECGMRAPVDEEAAREGATWVGSDVPSPPHQISYELFVQSDPLFQEMPGKIVILDMVREAGILHPVLELKLVAKTDLLELVVHGDHGPVALEGGAIAPEGSVVTVELTKSLGPDTGDASVRLRIDDQPWVEASCFDLWENLPDGVRFGVVDVESSSPRGVLEFQPVGFRHQFFSNSR